MSKEEDNYCPGKNCPQCDCDAPDHKEGVEAVEKFWGSRSHHRHWCTNPEVADPIEARKGCCGDPALW